MPFVDRRREMPLFVTDTPPGMAVTPGALGAEEDEVVQPAPLDALGAHFRLSNQIFSAAANESFGIDPTPDSDFSAWEEIKGTDREQFWERYVDVGNRRQFDRVGREIDRETEDRKIRDATPLWMSLPMELAANVVDPTILIPGGAFYRGVKGSVSVFRSALNVGLATGAAVTVQEAGLQATQQLRTAQESAVNIGASVLLGGLLGAGGAKLLSRGEWQKATKTLEGDIEKSLVDNEPFPAPVGAAVGAQVTPGPDLDALTIRGRAAGVTAKATAWLNPGLRLAESPSAVTRDTAFNLFEMTQYLRGADDGIAAPRAVETLRKEWNAGLMQATDAGRTAFTEYRKRATGGLSRREFADAVGKSLRRGDVHEIPEVQATAQAWRKHVFDPLKDAAVEAKMLPEDVSPETAVSYFSRMWNRDRLVAEEHAFKRLTAEWMETQAPRWISEFEADAAAKLAKIDQAAENAAEQIAKLQDEIRLEREARFEDIPGRAREIANEVFNKLTGKGGDSVRPYNVTVAARGPLMGRTFLIPDEMVERWLESDVDVVGRRYQRIMSADVELTRKFGSVTMADQIKAMRDDFTKLRAETSSERELTRLNNAEKAAVRDIEGIRDLIRGTYKTDGIDTNFARVARITNMFNYIRSMGQVALSSLPEAYRTGMVHGLRPFMSTLGQAMRNQAGFRMSVKEAKLAGNIAERALSHRLATLAEIGDFYTARGPVEKFMANMTEVASTWNGIRLWTDWARMVASVATQHRILDNAIKFGAPQTEKVVDSAARFRGEVFLGATHQHAIRKIIKKFGKEAEREIDENVDEVFGYQTSGGRFLRLNDGPSGGRLEKGSVVEVPGTRGTLSARDSRYLAYLGVDEAMAARIAKEFAEHGEDAGGVKVANTENWTDAAAVRAYRAAINKDIDTQVVTRSVADIPLFANTPTGRLLFQFNSFNLASHQRVLLRGLQEGPARFVSGAIGLTTIGMAVVKLRSYATNTEVPDFAENPGWWIAEGLDYGGLFMVPMQLANAFEQMVGINPLKAPLKAFDEETAQSSRILNRNKASALLGPTAGLIHDIGITAGIPISAAAGDEITEGQQRAAERLLPFNSYLGLRQMLRYVVNPPEEP